MFEGLAMTTRGVRCPLRHIVVSRMIGGAVILALFGSCAAFAQNQTPPDYRDDRSTPEAVVESLYNAIERQEYLRAWSYFRDEPGRPTAQTFAQGYADTAYVRVRVGKGTQEGAAGSIYSSMPVVVEATNKAGSKTVFAGCYQLRVIQPGAQAEPPFIPLGIVKGQLKPTKASFGEAEGSCAGLN